MTPGDVVRVDGQRCRVDARGLHMERVWWVVFLDGSDEGYRTVAHENEMEPAA